jgi:hypothetical protein
LPWTYLAIIPRAKAKSVTNEQRKLCPLVPKAVLEVDGSLLMLEIQHEVGLDVCCRAQPEPFAMVLKTGP